MVIWNSLLCLVVSLLERRNTTETKKLIIQNQEAIQLMLEVEDDNFQDVKNKVFAYAMTDDKKIIKRLYRSRS